MRKHGVEDMAKVSEDVRKQYIAEMVYHPAWQFLVDRVQTLVEESQQTLLDEAGIIDEQHGIENIRYRKGVCVGVQETLLIFVELEDEAQKYIDRDSRTSQTSDST